MNGSDKNGQQMFESLNHIQDPMLSEALTYRPRSVAFRTHRKVVLLVAAVALLLAALAVVFVFANLSQSRAPKYDQADYSYDAEKSAVSGKDHHSSLVPNGQSDAVSCAPENHYEDSEEREVAEPALIVYEKSSGTYRFLSLDPETYERLLNCLHEGQILPDENGEPVSVWMVLKDGSLDSPYWAERDERPVWSGELHFESEPAERLPGKRFAQLLQTLLR